MRRTIQARDKCSWCRCVCEGVSNDRVCGGVCWVPDDEQEGTEEMEGRVWRVYLLGNVAWWGVLSV